MEFYDSDWIIFRRNDDKDMREREGIETGMLKVGGSLRCAKTDSVCGFNRGRS